MAEDAPRETGGFEEFAMDDPTARESEILNDLVGETGGDEQPSEEMDAPAPVPDTDDEMEAGEEPTPEEPPEEVAEEDGASGAELVADLGDGHTKRFKSVEDVLDRYVKATKHITERDAKLAELQAALDEARGKSDEPQPKKAEESPIEPEVSRETRLQQYEDYYAETHGVDQATARQWARMAVEKQEEDAARQKRLDEALARIEATEQRAKQQEMERQVLTMVDRFKQDRADFDPLTRDDNGALDLKPEFKELQTKFGVQHLEGLFALYKALKPAPDPNSPANAGKAREAAISRAASPKSGAPRSKTSGNTAKIKAIAADMDMTSAESEILESLMQS